MKERWLKRMSAALMIAALVIAVLPVSPGLAEEAAAVEAVEAVAEAVAVGAEETDEADEAPEPWEADLSLLAIMENIPGDISEDIPADGGECAWALSDSELALSDSELAANDAELLANAGIAISSANFPDAAFRAYVRERFDTDDDGRLSAAERDAVGGVYVEDMGIGTLEGIEFFARLKYLNCNENDLTLLNLEENAALESLDCDFNGLTALVLGENGALTHLSCCGNRLTRLDLSQTPALEDLFCDGNDIGTVDIGSCPRLVALLKKEMKISESYYGSRYAGWGGAELDMTIDAATTLTAGDRVLFSARVVEVDADHFPSEEFRDFVEQNFDADGDDWLSGEEIRAVTKIVLRSSDDYYDGENEMDCPSLKGIEYFTNLRSLECWGCGVESLDVRKNAKLKSLYCPYNELKALNVGQNAALTDLSCEGNALTALDVRQNKKLEWLYCGGNGLKKLDVSKNAALTDLSCRDNALSKLNVAKNAKLEQLNCAGNLLTSLDVSKNKKLEWLKCEGNRLKKLNLAKNAKLAELYCSGNRLTALDLSKNAKLERLWAQGNSIKKIDLKKCPKLQKALKQKRKKAADGVQWGRTTGGSYVPLVYIDAATKLTNGKKVLYQGK